MIAIIGAVCFIVFLIALAMFLFAVGGSSTKVESPTAESMIKNKNAQAELSGLSGLESAMKTVSLMMTPVSPVTSAITLGAFSLKQKWAARNNRKKTHMSDEWLTLAENNSSNEGKRYIATLLSKQGHVTLEQANKWLEREKKINPPKQAMSDVKAEFIKNNLAKK